MKSFIIIGLAILVKLLGGVFLSQGMTEVGQVDPLALVTPSAIFAFGVDILTNVWVVIGIFFLFSYTLLYLSSLSWLDLSYMLPMTTLGYALNAIFAWLLLKEEIANTRWMGTLVIMIGVLVVGIGGHQRSRRDALEHYREETLESGHEQE
ncbi:MAG: EamA family transporter [Chroococcales cyanobacterium]